MAKLSDLKDLVAKARTRAPGASGPHADHAKRGRARRKGGSDGSGADRPEPRPAHPDVSEVHATRRALAAAKHADGDVDLAVAFADVERLPTSRKVSHTPTRPAPVPHQRIADAEAALAASRYGADRASRHWEVGQEQEAEQTFVRRGLSTDILTKLRRGYWSVQGELDLHRMTTTEARDTLAEFVLAARQRGARCVRVIHGKGLTSPGKEPVLKGKVRKWLSHWDDVLAYCEAPPHAGGGGAVLVLLRGK
jgi:DNA-nicking Smr family endonuclease